MTNPTRITAPSVEPVALAAVKAHLRVDHDLDDALIGSYISAAREQAENILQRTLISSQWRATFPKFLNDGLPLRKADVMSVESVQYVDSAGTIQTLAPSDYRVIKSRAPALLRPGFNKNFPNTYSDPEAVIVTYTAGYGAAADAVPAPIKQWIMLRVGDLYENRGAEVVGTISSQLSNTFMDGLLDTYRVIEA